LGGWKAQFLLIGPIFWGKAYPKNFFKSFLGGIGGKFRIKKRLQRRIAFQEINSKKGKGLKTGLVALQAGIKSHNFGQEILQEGQFFPYGNRFPEVSSGGVPGGLPVG